ncbi:MAG: hypothetical protein AAFU64_00550 [Bacteroidota bacterium]
MQHIYQMDRLHVGKGIMIYGNREHKVLEVVWKGSTSSTEFQETAQFVLNIAQEWQINKWMINQKDMMIYPKDFEWAKQELIPEAQKKLDKNTVVAIVLSNNLFGEFSLKQALNDGFPNGNLNVAYFENSDEAWCWLVECNKDLSVD